MFEMLIREVAAKFGLGDKAGSILSALLGLMFQKQSGGLGGLLALFNKKGLASIASTCSAVARICHWALILRN